jgi:hypothetical protein
MRYRLNVLAQGSVALAFALAMPACDKEKSGADAEATGAIQAAVTVGGARHDVTAVYYKVVDAGGSCGDAAIAETTSVLETEALPGGVLPAGSGTHAGADGLFVLPPGNYRVCATPMSDGGPSRECAPTEGTASVIAEATTEILLVSQCGGDANGGLDTVVALNDPPKIDDLDIAPSKFITQCEAATITVTAADPDGDAVSFAWAITARPAGSSPSLQGTDAVGTFSTDMPGDYEVRVAVSDVHAASSSLSFPIHVSAENCGCVCPAGFTQLPDGGCAKRYDIDASHLVNQDASCDGLGVNLYNGCDGAPYGFQWTDVGGAFGSVRQIDVELESGIACGAGNRPVSLNGAEIGSFDTVGSCQCDSGHGLVSLPNVAVSSYVLGGANSVAIPAPDCEGLSQSGALGGAFARVTVTYSCEPSLCADVTCAPQDQCHIAGSCDLGTGLCSNPNAPDGTVCDDGDPTSAASVCISGACGALVQTGNVGYYDMISGQGNPSQEQPIVTAGGVPVDVFDLSPGELARLQVLFVQNPNNFDFGVEYLGQSSAITDAVASGMVLIIHDRFVTSANTILPGGEGFSIIREEFTDAANIDILDATTLVTNGPGGLLDNASLDNGNLSSHGFVVDGTLPGSSVRILSRTDPGQIVTMCYQYGAGAVIYSTIPLDYYLDVHDTDLGANMANIYAPNVVAYGLSGACARH